MTVTVQSTARCELCQNANSHWCTALNLSVRQAVDEVQGRAERHDGELPDLVVCLNCNTFQRRVPLHPRA